MPRGSTYVDNAQNRRLGRVGAPMGSTPVSRSSGASSVPSQGTYVDNAQNRSLGRVGAPMGSMPVSRSSGASSVGAGMGSATVSWSPYGGGGSSNYSFISHSSYIDNAYNQSVGPFGASNFGLIPMSVDNANNQSVGPFGASNFGLMPMSVDNANNQSVGPFGASNFGSMPVSRSSGLSSVPSQDTYVDNAYNQSLGRVGAALGSMSISKKGQGSTASSYSSEETELYVDNVLNRSLGRVEKPLETAPHHRPTTTEDRLHENDTINQGLGVTGKKITKKSFRKNEKKTDQPADLLSKIGCDDEPIDYDFGPVSDQEKENMTETFFNISRRQEEEAKWQESNQGKRAQTDVRVFKYDGQVIPFEEINLGKKIGHGGFGDVHFAKWDGSVVAVKKLRVQRVSQKRLRQFQDEVKVYCKLDHPHIVKFLGACIVRPNLAIVIEYMQKSLYDALHVEDVDYSDAEQYQIIRGMSDGLDYLHQKEVAHCDIKSTNILLDIPEDGVVAKISDFGLSMMKYETETSQSVAKVVQGVGTPKYSAPEVLAGDELDLVAMCKADVYSMAVVAWEVICHEEPFSGLGNKQQLGRRVMGVKGQVELKIPNDINISGGLLSLLKECWSRNANKRPSAEEFKERVGKFGGIK